MIILVNDKKKFIEEINNNIPDEKFWQECKEASKLFRNKGRCSMEKRLFCVKLLGEHDEVLCVQHIVELDVVGAKKYLDKYIESLHKYGISEYKGYSFFEVDLSRLGL